MITTTKRAILLAGSACMFVMPVTALALPGEMPTDADTRAAKEEDAPASAQRGIEEIVVTAQKREESVQKAPLAITAVSGAALRSSGVSTVDAIAANVPNLQLGQTYGSANVSLRGISLNAVNWGVEGSIAFHQDGVFIQRPAAVLAGFYDVQRVEVLRGPQGTLYGRNATGGAINLITADPTPHTGGYFQATAGTYEHFAGEGAIGGPLLGGSDVLQYRLAFRVNHHSGYGRNEFTGTRIDDADDQAVRFKLAIKPGGRFSALLSADYSHSDDRQTPHYGGTPFGAAPFGVALPLPDGSSLPLGGQLPTRVRDISSDLDPEHSATFWGVAAKLDYDLGFGDLKSITSYRRGRNRTIGDLDQTSVYIASRTLLADNSKQFSQEFQLSGRTPSSDWLAGLFYYHETDRGNNNIPWNNIILNVFGVPVPAPGTVAQGYFDGSEIKTDAYAAFGQYTRHIGSKLSVTLGARYSVERKAAINQGAFDLVTPYDPAVGIITPSEAAGTLQIQCGAGLTTIGFAAGDCVPYRIFRSFTPKFGLEYQVDPRTLVYASVSRGFKSGTYNLGSPQPPVNPEKVTDYELGVKSTLFNGKLRANLSAFYYDYKDLQVNRVVVTSVVLENAANAEIYGLEGELVARPAPALQFDFSGAYLHARFKRFISGDSLRPGGDGVTVDEFGNPAFNLAGKTLPQSPDFSGKFGISGFVDAPHGKVTLRAEAVYTDKIFFTPFNLDTVAVGARTRFNASINYVTRDERWEISLNAKNLADNVRITNGFVASTAVGAVVNGYLEAPRTVDLSVTMKF